MAVVNVAVKEVQLPTSLLEVTKLFATIRRSSSDDVAVPG
jgi:hypothetical protein